MDLGDEEEEARRVQELDADEPLLRENPRRFVMFPIEHHDIWQFYKKAEGTRVGHFAQLARCLASRL